MQFGDAFAGIAGPAGRTAPLLPKTGNGRSPTGPEQMSRMYHVANWFKLGDKAREKRCTIFREFH
jgi:hypothetical protein